MAMAAHPRPAVIRRSGQGGATGSEVGARPRAGSDHSDGGRRDHGKRVAQVFSTKGSPTASVRPITWLAMPILPSCMAQTSGLVVLTSPRPDCRHASSWRGYRKAMVAPQASRRHVAYRAQSLVRADRGI